MIDTNSQGETVAYPQDNPAAAIPVTCDAACEWVAAVDAVIGKSWADAAQAYDDAARGEAVAKWKWAAAVANAHRTTATELPAAGDGSDCTCPQPYDPEKPLFAIPIPGTDWNIDPSWGNIKHNAHDDVDIVANGLGTLFGKVKKVLPQPDAGGAPHSGFKTDENGRVTGYTEFDENGRPVKRFRGTGKPHAEQLPPIVYDPEKPGGVPKRSRTPTPDELPAGY